MTPFIVAAMLALSPLSAGGRVDVKPAPHEAQLRLEGNRVVKSKVQRPKVANIGSKKPWQTPEAYKGCRVDPVVGNYGCRDVEPADPDADDPQLTPGDVLRAVKEIGLPSLQVKVQPGDQTLVNVATIFYAEPQPFERSVELLGFDVDVVAEPVAYRWVHGDGTVATTSEPGRPYPATDVTHRYDAPADGVHARVDVTYRVRYRVDGGPWATIGQTLQASGPAAVLDVKEAAPVLAKP